MIKKIILLLAIVGPFGLYFLYSWLLKLEKKKIPILKLTIASIILLIIALGFLRFSAGFDLAVMKSGEGPAREMLRSGVELFLRCYSFPRPVIAACNGHALAAGAILLMSCDLRIGTKGEFKIGLPELAIGMSLPLFATELAKDRISKRHFTKATALGSTFNPEEACDAGFLDEIVNEDELLSTALDRAESLKAIGKTQLSLTRSTTRGETIRKIRDTLEDDLSRFVVKQ